MKNEISNNGIGISLTEKIIQSITTTLRLLFLKLSSNLEVGETIGVILIQKKDE